MIKSLYIVFFVLLSGLSSYGQVINISETDDIKQIGGSVSLCVDSFSKFSLENIQAQKFNSLNSTKIPNLDVTSNTWWVKTKIKNVGKSANFILNFDQPILNDVVFYTFQNNVLKDSVKIGESVPFYDREIIYTTPAISFLLNTNEEMDVLIKVQSHATLILDLQLGSSYKINAINNVKDNLLNLYYGSIIVMFLYNLFIYFSIREKIYRYYVIYIFFLIFVQITLDGFGFKWFWSNYILISQQSFFIFTSLVNVTGIEFVRVFIQSKKLSPKLDKLHVPIYLSYFIICCLSLMNYRFLAYNLILPLAGISATFLVV
ncbi:MAG: hypothetical protein HYZ42_13625, partial [Bacteroidetes bacterium]|nr:hypothetical protein [Bacteroidota bacterium]